MSSFSLCLLFLVIICIANGGNATIKKMKQQLKRILSRRQKLHIFDANRTAAAVLVPIFDKQGRYYILFTKRTEKVKEHKGEISFPGGAYEEGDGTMVDTALRECAEEIGLMTDEVEVIGELDDIVSRTSNYSISSFVAVIPWPHRLKVDGEEVEEIIEVPIRELMDRDCLRQETEIVNGEKLPLHFYHHKGRVIWGATARILNQFLDILTQVMEDSR